MELLGLWDWNYGTGDYGTGDYGTGDYGTGDYGTMFILSVEKLRCQRSKVSK